jgi:quercetin dioxygenase-like cupin family protein
MIEVVRADPGAARAGYAAPGCALTGAAASASACPPDASIWMLAARLEAGASLAFDSEHGDEALYVEAGELSVDGRICPEGGAIVVEAGVSPRIEAHGASRVLHMGSRDPRAAGAGAKGRARGVHVIGPRGVCEAIEPGRETRFFADATCPTCGVWLLYTSRIFGYEAPVHSHSQDELIHVLRGEIFQGSLRAGPGDTLFVAADQPYRFRAGASGFAYLNYRRAASVMTMRATGQTILENGRATGMKPLLPRGDDRCRSATS